MFHLMVKDMYTQKKTAYFAPLILLFYFPMTEKSNVIAVMIYSLAIGFMAYYMAISANFSTDESEKNQNRLLLSLPVTRREVINAKYIMISVWWLISYLSYVFIMLILQGLLHFDTHVAFDIKIIALSLCFSYLLLSVFYPVHYKFGFRTASMVGIGIFFLIASGVGKLIPLLAKTEMFSIIIEKPILSFSIITFVLVLVSYLLSLNYFTKKDF